MAATYDDTDLREARFTGADLTGATFRDCILTRAKIVDCWLVDVSLSGEVQRVVVNDVDVTPFVTQELDRRHPERIPLRAMTSAADYREMWATLERLWSETVARAERLPEPTRHERVDDEWSLVETLRHLLFATDAWAGNAVADPPRPYHRLGFPASGYPAELAAALGLELDAQPSYAEVLTARAESMSFVRELLAGLSDTDLERPRLRLPAPGYPEASYSVGRCLGVVLREEAEHRRYMERDLAVLEARQQS